MEKPSREQIFAQYAAGALSGLLARIPFDQSYDADRVVRNAISFAGLIMAEHDRLFPEPEPTEAEKPWVPEQLEGYGPWIEGPPDSNLESDFQVITADERKDKEFQPFSYGAMPQPAWLWSDAVAHCIKL